MMNFPSSENYASVIEKVKEIIQPIIPSMIKKNSEADVGGGEDYVFAVYSFETNKPHVFIGIQSLLDNNFHYLIYSDEDFDVSALIRKCIVLVIETLAHKNEKEQMQIIKTICQLIKSSLFQLNPPLRSVSRLKNENHHLKVSFTLDPYSQLDSDSLIKEQIHNIKNQ